MNAYWQLTLAQLRIFARNRQVLFWTLAFPIFLMIMLGSFLGKGDSLSLNGLILDQDGTEASASMAAALQSNPLIAFKSSSDREESMRSLKQGDQQVVIVIPQGYGATVQSGPSAGRSGPSPGHPSSTASILAYYDETNLQKSQMALAVVNQIAEGVSQKLVGYTPVVKVEQQGIQALHLEYIDFLVPGIVAMMIMSNNLNGVAGQIASWRERGILRRMQSTTLKPGTFIAAQITARLALNGAQALVVLAVARFIFHTQVNGSWLLLLLFVVLGTLAFMAIGFIIAGLAKTPESAGPIAGFISFPLMFMGGVFFPINSMPAFLQPIVKALPISHLTTALRQVMNVGAGLSTLWSEAALLCGWLVVAFIVSTFTFKWE